MAGFVFDDCLDCRGEATTETKRAATETRSEGRKNMSTLLFEEISKLELHTRRNDSYLYRLGATIVLKSQRIKAHGPFASQDLSRSDLLDRARWPRLLRTSIGHHCHLLPSQHGSIAGTDNIGNTIQTARHTNGNRPGYF